MTCFSGVVHFSFPFLVHYRIPSDTPSDEVFNAPRPETALSRERSLKTPSVWPADPRSKT